MRVAVTDAECYRRRLMSSEVFIAHGALAGCAASPTNAVLLNAATLLYAERLVSAGFGTTSQLPPLIGHNK
jgi:hypothetical protein